MRSAIAAGATLAAGIAGLAQPAHAQLSGVGPVDGAHGYPLWYEDSNGLRLDLCLDGPPNCLAGLVNPSLPATVGNMPDESFWWGADAQMTLPTGGDALLVLAQEAAWLNEIPEAGQNMAFARVRIRVTGLVVGEQYTVTYPYGTKTFTAEAADRNINFTDDIGCAVAPCDFGLSLTGEIGPFLTWDPAQAPAPPAGFIGNPAVEHTVVGSPVGTNFFRITGPGLGAGGVQTDKFTVQGKLATGAQSTPDLVASSDSGSSDSDNETRDTSPVFTGFVDQPGATVEVLVDGTVAGSGTATGTTYRVATAGVTPGRHLVTTRIAGSGAVSNALALVVDTTAPSVTRLSVRPNPFNLNRARLTRFSLHASEAADVQMAVRRSGLVVKSLGTQGLGGPGNALFTWNATDNANQLVSRGRYVVRTTVVDVAGNRSVAQAPFQVVR
jgi:Bacterial Ig-like domain